MNWYARDQVSMRTLELVYWKEYGMVIPSILFLDTIQKEIWNQIFDGTPDSTGTPLTS